MCTVSSQLKLCTCSGKEIDRNKPYWILYRKRKTVKWIMGQVFLRLPQDLEMMQQDSNRIEKQLNESNVFDFDPNLEEGDRLFLFFQRGRMDFEDIDFLFAYNSSVWKPSHFAPFESQKEFKELKKGFIRDALDSGE